MERTFYTEADLRAFAAQFARLLRAGDVVALSGPLGSGKTAFIKAAVAERLESDCVTSPTFTFWHRYGGDPPIDHLDFYRIESPREAEELGIEGALAGASILFVEWPERAAHLLPEMCFAIDLEGKGNGPRTMRLRGPRELQL